jgi:hypothetical protein
MKPVATSAPALTTALPSARARAGAAFLGALLECAVFVVRRGRVSRSAASSSIQVDEGGGGEGVEIEGEGGGQEGDDTSLFAREIARVWVALGGRAPSLNSADTSEKTENEGKKLGEEIKPRLHVDARRAAGIVRGALGAAGGVGGGEFFFFLDFYFIFSFCFAFRV